MVNILSTQNSWQLCELQIIFQARKQILEDFSGRSVLYQSLLPLNPNFELNIEVESPVITLKRPKNVAAKRQEVAERRIAEEARR